MNTLPNYTRTPSELQERFLLQLFVLIAQATRLKNWPVCFALSELIERVKMRGDGRGFQIEEGAGWEVNPWTHKEDHHGLRVN